MRHLCCYAGISWPQSHAARLCMRALCMKRMRHVCCYAGIATEVSHRRSHRQRGSRRLPPCPLSNKPWVFAGCVLRLNAWRLSLVSCCSRQPAAPAPRPFFSFCFLRDARRPPARPERLRVAGTPPCPVRPCDSCGSTCQPFCQRCRAGAGEGGVAMRQPRPAAAPPAQCSSPAPDR